VRDKQIEISFLGHLNVRSFYPLRLTDNFTLNHYWNSLCALPSQRTTEPTICL